MRTKLKRLVFIVVAVVVIVLHGSRAHLREIRNSTVKINVLTANKYVISILLISISKLDRLGGALIRL